ncbi:histidine triad (HIT) family protein [Streptacidiphilus sp. MAP12-20]|uniref:HIT family protein n=1 Tax=Streptacidiphilus sp. MAP12-20 TaxID=3156299 RepID=UPI00351467CE
MERQSTDPDNDSADRQRRPCFVCAVAAGDADHRDEIIYEDEGHLAFLHGWPLLPARLLVAPKQHVEHAVGDVMTPAFLRTMQVLRLVALAVEDVLGGERTYVSGVDGQAETAHVHWQVARTPEGDSPGGQGLETTNPEYAVFACTAQEQADLPGRLRTAVAAQRRRGPWASAWAASVQDGRADVCPGGERGAAGQENPS